MPFRPQVNDTLQIDGAEYRFTPHPVAKDMPYGQQGRRATVYQVEVNHSTLLALKVFTQSFRSPGIAESASRIRPYAGVPGLQVCARLVVTPEQHAPLLEKHPDLKYACLMPWVMGATWQEVMIESRPLTEVQSLELSFALVRILATMEQKGLAHCDLSGPNIILPGLDDPAFKAPVALVDVEEMYGTTLSRPEKLSAGSPGYAHKAAARGIWNVHADRFAGAIILAEMLCWCDEEIRKQVYGEQFFDPAEIHQDSERYRLIKNTLEKLWGSPLSNLFDRTWYSNTLEECPNFIEWGQAIFTVRKQQRIEDYSIQWKTFEEEIAPPLTSYKTQKIVETNEVSSPHKVAESMLVEAGKLETQGRTQDAVALYRSAKMLLEKDDPLLAEVDLILLNLESEKNAGADTYKNIILPESASPAKAEMGPQNSSGENKLQKADTFPSAISPTWKKRLAIGALVVLVTGFLFWVVSKLFTRKNFTIGVIGLLGAGLIWGSVQFMSGNTSLQGRIPSTSTPVVSIPATATVKIDSETSVMDIAKTTETKKSSPSVSTAISLPTLTPTAAVNSNLELIYVKDDGQAKTLSRSTANGNDEKEVSDISDMTFASQPRMQLSPDQEKVAYVVPQGNTFLLVIIDMESGSKKEVTIPGAIRDNLLGSPDGKFVSFNNNQYCYDVDQDKIINYGQRIDNVGWSPDGAKVAGKVGTSQLAVYEAGDNQPQIIEGVSFSWADEENLLYLSLEQTQTMLIIHNLNVKSGEVEEVYRQGIAGSCNLCEPIKSEWIISVSPSKGKVVIYRVRAPYNDILVLNLFDEKASGFYIDGVLWLWAGWTDTSQGIFLASEEVDVPTDYPETVLQIPQLVKDASNALSYSVSHATQQVAILVCQDNAGAAEKCEVVLADKNRKITKITEAPQAFYWQNGITWSPDDTMLAYVAEKDNVPNIVVMQIKEQKELLISPTTKQTIFFWMK